MGFWNKYPHTLYNSNDTITNIICAIKCLYNVNVEQTKAIDKLTADLSAESAARIAADNKLNSDLTTETAERKAADYTIDYIAATNAINIKKGVI